MKCYDYLAVRIILTTRHARFSSRASVSGLPRIAFETLNVSGNLLHYLDCRYRKLLRPTDPVVEYPVSTAMVIMLKATAHGEDLQRVVRDMDTSYHWGDRELREKLKYTTEKLKKSSESKRIMDSRDQAAVDACLLRKLKDPYTSMPDPKKQRKAAAAATAESSATAAASSASGPLEGGGSEAPDFASDPFGDGDEVSFIPLALFAKC